MTTGLSGVIRSVITLFVFILLVLAAGFFWLWSGVFWHPQTSAASFSCEEAVSPVSPVKSLKVMTFNVQFMAGKNYVFFYDAPGATDTRPELKDIMLTTKQVAQILRAQSPDIVIIQELLGDGDVRGHHRDQLRPLLKELQSINESGASIYPCFSQTGYWQARWIPHPKVWGGVDMNLVTLSRYPIVDAVRYQLPYMQSDPVNRRFYFQRALLEVTLDVGGQTIAVLNTHLDAWGGNTEVMPKQVGKVLERLDALDKNGIPWLLGGDFNLLPPEGGLQWAQLHGKGVDEYSELTAIEPLYRRYLAVPQLQHVLDRPTDWYTYNPNNPDFVGPDRTIDYLFASEHWRIKSSQVLTEQGLKVSDHLPLTAEFDLDQ